MELSYHPWCWGICSPLYNTFYDQPLLCGSESHYEDLGRRFSLFQPILRKSSDCKVIIQIMIVSHNDLECQLLQHVWFRVLPRTQKLDDACNGKHLGKKICFLLQLLVTFKKTSKHCFSFKSKTKADESRDLSPIYSWSSSKNLRTKWRHRSGLMAASLLERETDTDRPAQDPEIWALEGPRGRRNQWSRKTLIPSMMFWSVYICAHSRRRVRKSSTTDWLVGPWRRDRKWVEENHTASSPRAAVSFPARIKRFSVSSAWPFKAAISSSTLFKFAFSIATCDSTSASCFRLTANMSSAAFSSSSAFFNTWGKHEKTLRSVWSPHPTPPLRWFRMRCCDGQYRISWWWSV